MGYERVRPQLQNLRVHAQLVLTPYFRRGYLFLGTPESRPTAQPPEDYYVYFVPPYGSGTYTDEKKRDEVFFIFKDNEDFKNEVQE